MKRGAGLLLPFTRRGACLAVLLLSMVASFAPSFGQNRFPRPEFQSGYQQPETVFPAARAELYGYQDVVVLLGALGLASWLALKKRSRRGIFWLTIGALAYFGFFRKGCICPIGAVQNTALAVADPSFVLPVAVAFFVGLPLIFSLLFGRVFCSSVCPLGAIQDVFVFKPKKINPQLAAVLGIIPHLYLGAAILFATTGAGFVICRFDPFVGFFRLSAPLGMILWGGAVLAVGLFVARPYCRFLCPYGVLLGWSSLVSRRHVTITPDKCINCRLCEDSCPFDAIRIPTTHEPDEPRRKSVGRVLLHSGLLPLWIFVGGLAGWFAGDTLALVHHRVRLAEQVLAEETGGAETLTMESETFRAGMVPVPALIEDARDIKKNMKRGSLFLGMYLGLVVGLGMLRYSLQRKREEYAPNTRTCLSCGRCFEVCPREHRRRKMENHATR